MRGDGRVDQIAAEAPEPRKRPILVRSREPAISDHIRDQDRREFSGLAHRAPLAESVAQKLSTRFGPTPQDRKGQHCSNWRSRLGRFRRNRHPSAEDRFLALTAGHGADLEGQNGSNRSN